MSSRNRRGAASFARKQKQYQICSDDDETEESSKFGGVLATLKNKKNLQQTQRKISTRGKNNYNRKIITSPPLQKPNKEGKTITDENGRTPPPRAVVVRESTQVISPMTAQKMRQQSKKNKEPTNWVRRKIMDGMSNDMNIYSDNENNKIFEDSFMEESSHDRSSGSDTLGSHSENDFSKMSSDNDKDESRQRSDSCYSLSNSEDMTQVCCEDDDDDDDVDDEEEEDEEDEEEEEEEEEEEYSDSEEEFESGVDDEEFIPDEEDEEDDESVSTDDFIVEDTPPKRRRPQREAALKSLTKIKQQSRKDKVGKAKTTGRIGVTNDTLSDETKIPTLDAPTPKINTDTPDVSITTKTCIVNSEESNTTNLQATIAVAKNAINERDMVKENESAQSVIYDEEVLNIHDTPDDTVLEETPTKAGLPRKTLDFSSPEPQMAMIVDDDEPFSDNDDDVLIVTIIDSDDFSEGFNGDEESNTEIDAAAPKDTHNPTIVIENQSCDGRMNKSIINDDDNEDCDNDQLQSLSISSREQPDSPDVKYNNDIKEYDSQSHHFKKIQINVPLSSIKTIKTKSEIHSAEEKAVSFSQSPSEEPIWLDTKQNNDIKENEAQSKSLKGIRSNAPLSSTEIIKPKSDDLYRQEGAVKRGKWALGAKIGVGSFGQVHVGMNTRNGILMAVKIFRMEEAVMKDVRTEVELMRSLKHVNIVRYLGAQMDKNFLHIFQEWVPGGSVSSLLSKFGSFSIEVIQSYMSQTLCGLTFLHDNDIMHRDIKGSNILVNDKGIVKLADFGASKRLKNLSDNMMMSLTVRGTPYFMAPEVFEEKYGFKADIWGVGCVAFQMATTRPPWKHKGFTNPVSLFNYIKKQKGGPPMDHPQKESFSKRQRMSWNLFEDFVRTCFEQDPVERPTTKELIDDPFFLTDCECDGDDESTHYRGLFSPEHKINNSKLPSSDSDSSDSIGQLMQTKTTLQLENTTFFSPQYPRKNIERPSQSVYECNTPPQQQHVHSSPSPDAREWPDWARAQLKEQNNCKEKIPKINNELRHDLSELMGSLALSEDSDQKPLRERRFSIIGGSTAYSKLAGLNFLESSNATNK